MFGCISWSISKQKPCDFIDEKLLSLPSYKKMFYGRMDGAMKETRWMTIFMDKRKAEDI